MNYCIFRHETAIGNSGEQIVGLAKHLKRTSEKDPLIYFEKDFQGCFARCIPGVDSKRVMPFPELQELDYGSPTWKGYENPFFDGIAFQSAYPFKTTFPGTWKDLLNEPDIKLEFPFDEYDNHLNLPRDTIVIANRERNTHYNRIDGWGEGESQRFVNPDILKEYALYYANKGYIVVRIGSLKQSPFPLHKNIIDLAMIKNRNWMDDLYLLATCKLFMSTDSGIWPMAGGFKTPMVLSNVAKKFYTDWLDENCSRVLFKENGVDNSFKQLVESSEVFL